MSDINLIMQGICMRMKIRLNTNRRSNFQQADKKIGVAIIL